MSEFDDLSLREAFAQFHTDALTAVPSQDIAGVRAIARRRRTTRAGVIAAMAALVLAVPVAAHAFVGRSAPAPPAVRPSHSPSPNASPTPAASPSASPSASATPVPDGKISLKDLGNATLDIPAWPKDGMQCATKRQKFTNGETPASADGPSAHMMIQKVEYADVDHDGAQETIALLMCFIQGGDEQVVVFDRDTSGKIVTFGQVLTENKSIKGMTDVRGEADGSVSVQVRDIQVCCGTNPAWAEYQWRTYAWNGTGFEQTDGPTAFHPAPTPNDLSVTTSSPEIALGPLAGGVRKGTVSVTVRNNGPRQSPGLVLSFDFQQDPALPTPVRLATPVQGCEDMAATQSSYAYIKCHLPGLATGASRTYTFTLASPQANDSVTQTKANRQQTGPVWWITAAEEQPGIRELRDPQREDNQVAYAVTRAD